MNERVPQGGRTQTTRVYKVRYDRSARASPDVVIPSSCGVRFRLWNEIFGFKQTLS